MRQLDFSGREKLYYQLYNILFQLITNGTYKIGTCIPSESELMSKYEVSRMTARKSMEMLANQGMVLKKIGVGTVVTATHPNSSPQKLVSYSKKNSSQNDPTSKRVISIETTTATKTIASALRLPEESSVIHLKRLCSSKTKPLYLEFHYFEQNYFPDLINRDFSSESLRAYLSNSCGIGWSHAEQQVFSIVSDSCMAHLLDIEEREPLLLVKRISYDVYDVPREYVETYYRSDEYHIEIKLSI